MAEKSPLYRIVMEPSKYSNRKLIFAIKLSCSNIQSLRSFVAVSQLREISIKIVTSYFTEILRGREKCR